MNFLKENKEKNKKIKVYKIKKDKPYEKLNQNVKNFSQETISYKNILGNSSKYDLRKYLLIRLYGLNLGNIIFENIFSKYKI